jgi:hypothetical protein
LGLGPPVPDPDAAYAARIELDLGDVTPESRDPTRCS